MELTIHVEAKSNAIEVMLFVSSSMKALPRKKKCRSHFLPRIMGKTIDRDISIAREINMRYSNGIAFSET